LATSLPSAPRVSAATRRLLFSLAWLTLGAIVVLGGLLQDEYAGNEEKVPLLGDIPIVGNLFRTETRSRKKTNLMVFLRPVVVRDAAQADALSLDRYDLMRGRQEQAQPVPRVMTPINEAPILPQLPPPAPVQAVPAPAPAPGPDPSRGGQ